MKETNLNKLKNVLRLLSSIETPDVEIKSEIVDEILSVINSVAIGSTQITGRINRPFKIKYKNKPLDAPTTIYFSSTESDENLMNAPMIQYLFPVLQVASNRYLIIGTVSYCMDLDEIDGFLPVFQVDNEQYPYDVFVEFEEDTLDV